MADNIILPKLQTFLLRTKRKSEEQSEEIIRFAEDRLPGFIRTHFDPTLKTFMP
jgi:hypothetical protein